MLAEEKRRIAQSCLFAALKGDFKTASRIRWEAYQDDEFLYSERSWRSVWEEDYKYLSYLIQEDFSDMNNSLEKIKSLKAGIFVDYLFDFRDFWGVTEQSHLSKEAFYSETLETFLRSKNWTFKSENREIIYAQTKKINISSRIYFDAIKGYDFDLRIYPYIYPIGEYDLGFPPNASKEAVDARRRWLEMYNQYLDMSLAGIEKFPKTFKTFEKHKLLNDEKYLDWVRQYTLLTNPEK